MEIASQDQDHDMPIPLNTTYGGVIHGHMTHNHHHHAPNNNITTTTQPPQMPLHVSNGHEHHHQQHQEPSHVGYNAIIKKPPIVKYKECLKNHAASMGGNAIDGCGEFMPSGEDGSIEALTCSACNCHRNFHRKEIDGETAISSYHNHQSRKLILSHNNQKIRSAMPHQMIMPIGVSNYRYIHNNSESEDFMEEDGVIPHLPYNNQNKKRFRTKFTVEQKEKMLSFAERVGWKLQRQEDSVVQRFCEEIGVKRRVLKVWMHNNKLHLSKKNSNINLEDDNNNDNEKINNVDLSGNNNDIITKINVP